MWQKNDVNISFVEPKLWDMTKKDVKFSRFYNLGSNLFVKALLHFMKRKKGDAHALQKICTWWKKDHAVSAFAVIFSDAKQNYNYPEHMSGILGIRKDKKKMSHSTLNLQRTFALLYSLKHSLLPHDFFATSCFIGSKKIKSTDITSCIYKASHAFMPQAQYLVGHYS